MSAPPRNSGYAAGATTGWGDRADSGFGQQTDPGLARDDRQGFPTPWGPEQAPDHDRDAGRGYAGRGPAPRTAPGTGAPQPNAGFAPGSGFAPDLGFAPDAGSQAGRRPGPGSAGGPGETQGRRPADGSQVPAGPQPGDTATMGWGPDGQPRAAAAPTRQRPTWQSPIEPASPQQPPAQPGSSRQAPDWQPTGPQSLAQPPATPEAPAGEAPGKLRRRDRKLAKQKSERPPKAGRKQKAAAQEPSVQKAAAQQEAAQRAPGADPRLASADPRRSPAAAAAGLAPAASAGAVTATRPGTAAPGRSAPAEPARRAAKGRPRRAGRKKARRLVLLIGGVGVVAAGAAAYGLMLAGTGGPAHVITTPQRIGSYAQAPPLAASMKATQLRNGIVAKSGGEATHVVDAVYQDGASPTGGSGAQIMLFIGGNLSGSSAGSFISSFVGRLPGAVTTPAGSLGGAAACVPSVSGRPAECAWADNDTFGIVLSPTLGAQALASELRQMRPQVEHVVK